MIRPLLIFLSSTAGVYVITLSANSTLWAAMREREIPCDLDEQAAADLFASIGTPKLAGPAPVYGCRHGVRGLRHEPRRLERMNDRGIRWTRVVEREMSNRISYPNSEDRTK
jgi:hypothetical protein